MRLLEDKKGGLGLDKSLDGVLNYANPGFSVAIDKQMTVNIILVFNFKLTLVKSAQT